MADLERAELMAALNRAMRAVSGQGVLYSQALAERIGIGSTDLECLDIIVMQGPVTAGDLARASGLTSGAITGVIDRLSRAGFARREQDRGDRRKVLVRALPAVERRVLPLSRPMEQGMSALLSEYGDRDLALLLDFLLRAHEGAVAATTVLRAETAAKTANVKRDRRPPRGGDGGDGE